LCARAATRGLAAVSPATAATRSHCPWPPCLFAPGWTRSREKLGFGAASTQHKKCSRTLVALAAELVHS
jgi:hypothetical protein